MTSNRIIRSITLCAVALLLLSACSIYDEYPARRHYDVILRIADGTDQVLPGSVASVNTLYAFKNNILAGKYTIGEDGHFHIDSDLEGNDSLTFVALHSEQDEKMKVNEPVIGESIHNVWLQMHIQGDSIAAPLTPKYHGKLTVYSHTNTNQEHIVYMQDKTAKARVYAKNLLPTYGEGNYRVVLEGLYSGIAYSGTSDGNRVNYRLPGRKATKETDWATDPVTILPTGKNPCRLLIYKNDGGLIIDTIVDENNKPLKVSEQDDVVFYVTITKDAEGNPQFSVKVLPFEDVDNNFTFE